MRGFAFSLDMAFGVLLVIALVSLLAQTIQPAHADAHTLLQLRAKDASLEWFYSSPTPLSAPVVPSGKDVACSTAFRPVVATIPLDPSQASSWVFQTVCEGAP